jgi:hypothetical protein
MPTVLLPNKLLKLNNKKNKATEEIDPFVFGKKLGLMAKLFGCRHKNISRPFTQGKTAYRDCLDCGARRQFNPETWETQGSFYFPPFVENERIGLR